MGLILKYGPGQTPLSEEAKRGLKISTILTQGELDQFEQRNISSAIKWLRSKRYSPITLFSDAFVRTLHRRMYGEVWTWAGDFRRVETNIGVPPHQIAIELKMLLEDAKYWHEHEVYPPINLAIRLKHKLVSIHCFPNGNGRHSRLVADLIMEKLFDDSFFSWGGGLLTPHDDKRNKYIKALQLADKGLYDDLIAFAKS